MTEKLLPCPFCGSTSLDILPENPDSEGDAWGAVQCVNFDCPTYDGFRGHGVRVGDGQDVSDERGSDAYKSQAIAAWNRRPPAPEGEAWRTVPREPTEAEIKAVQAALTGPAPAYTGRTNTLDRFNLLARHVASAMLAASPIVPAPEGEVVCSGCEGHPVFPNVPCAVCGASSVDPVGRDENTRTKLALILDKAWSEGLNEQRLSEGKHIDAILAALGTKATDTGREDETDGPGGQGGGNLTEVY